MASVVVLVVVGYAPDPAVAAAAVLCVVLLSVLTVAYAPVLVAFAAVAPGVLGTVVVSTVRDDLDPAVAVAAVPCALVPFAVPVAAAQVPVVLVAAGLHALAAVVVVLVVRDVPDPAVAAGIVLYVVLPAVLIVADAPLLVVFAAVMLCVLVPSAVPVAYALVLDVFAVVVLVVPAPALVFLVSGGRGPAPALAVPVYPPFPCSQKVGSDVVDRQAFLHAPLFRIISHRRGFLAWPAFCRAPRSGVAAWARSFLPARAVRSLHCRFLQRRGESESGAASFYHSVKLMLRR